jgi:hypothetical protein
MQLGTRRSANVTAAATAVITVAAGITALDVDHMFGLQHWAHRAGPGSSDARQVLFLAQSFYREYARKSWDALFERANVKPRYIKIFLNRAVKIGNTIGVGDDDLAWVIYHTKQFQAELAQLRGVDKDWQEMAVMGGIGLYQIRVDRAMGVQAGSFDLTSTATRAGRGLNGLILGTLAIHGTVTVTQWIRQFHEDWLTIRTGQLTEDVLAIGLMAAVRILGNRSGQANLDLATRQKLVDILQGAMLTALAARGATNVANDFIHLALLSGHGLILQWVAIAADTGLTYQAAKAAYYEWSRQLKDGVPDRGTANKNTQLLLTAIFLSSLIHAIIGH